jgi:hypothetical protein
MNINIVLSPLDEEWMTCLFSLEQGKTSLNQLFCLIVNQFLKTGLICSSENIKYLGIE